MHLKLILKLCNYFLCLYVDIHKAGKGQDASEEGDVTAEDFNFDDPFFAEVSTVRCMV